MSDIKHYRQFAGGGSYSIKTDKGYELWEIPLHGGIPQFVQLCKTEQEAKELSETLT